MIPFLKKEMILTLWNLLFGNYVVNLNVNVERVINLLFFFLFTLKIKKVWLLRLAVQVEGRLAAFTKSSLFYVPYYS